jgi:hypothetical protein
MDSVVYGCGRTELCGLSLRDSCGMNGVEKFAWIRCIDMEGQMREGCLRSTIPEKHVAFKLSKAALVAQTQTCRQTQLAKELGVGNSSRVSEHGGRTAPQRHEGRACLSRNQHTSLP